MEPKTYERAVLLDICGGTEEAARSLFPHLTLDERGLWLDRHAPDELALALDEADAKAEKPDRERLAKRRLEAERGGWSWHPHRNSSLEVLKFPFTAYSLAALMLAGDGRNLFAEWEDTSSEFDEQLRRLSENADEARECLREAFRLYRLAVDKFGRADDGAIRQSADWLLNDAHSELMRSPAAMELPPEREMLATPAQLIAAFGPMTGMNKSWFSKLEGPLLRARKVEGMGHRGSRTQPLFCPFEVMVWLMSPKRKKGMKFFNDETPWRKLKEHFPAAHAAHALGDPNE